MVMGPPQEARRGRLQCGAACVQARPVIESSQSALKLLDMDRDPRKAPGIPSSLQIRPGMLTMQQVRWDVTVPHTPQYHHAGMHVSNELGLVTVRGNLARHTASLCS